VRLGGEVIKTFLGFLAGGDLVIKQRPDRGNKSPTPNYNISFLVSIRFLVLGVGGLHRQIPPTFL